MPSRLKYSGGPGYPTYQLEIEFQGEVPPIGTVFRFFHATMPWGKSCMVKVVGHNWELVKDRFEVTVHVEDVALG